MKSLEIPEFVRGIHESTGWTQEELARQIGVSFSTVNGWERGRRNPQPYLRKRLEELAIEHCEGSNEQHAT
jgi:transcriptional regulator with XRE-family HTH domain